MLQKKEHQRMKEVLAEAITVLCKASLVYRKQFTIEGLIGITLDSDEIVLVNINEQVRKELPSPSPSDLEEQSRSATNSSQRSPKHRRKRRRDQASPEPLEKQSRSESPSQPIIIKEEDDDDGVYGEEQYSQAAEQLSTSSFQEHQSDTLDQSNSFSQSTIDDYGSQLGFVGGDNSGDGSQPGCSSWQLQQTPPNIQDRLQPTQHIKEEPHSTATLSSYSEGTPPGGGVPPIPVLWPVPEGRFGRQHLLDSVNEMSSNEKKRNRYRHPCPFCPKLLRSRYELADHIRTHTGEKPFNCSFCDFKSAQKNNVTYHMKMKHPHLM